MIGAANLDYATFCRAFHNTLANDCKTELETLAEIKQKPFIAPNLDTSFLYKTHKWRWTFGTERMTGKLYKMLDFIRQKINSTTPQTEQNFKLHYTFRPLDTSLEGFVYLPNEATMPEKLDGIDAEMFDIVILPCLKKTLAVLKINLELPVGKTATLETCSFEQVKFGVIEPVVKKIPTIETTVNLSVHDGFTKVSREGKKALQKATNLGISKASPEQLKIAQVWHRQNNSPMPENLQKALTELKVE